MGYGMGCQIFPFVCVDLIPFSNPFACSDGLYNVKSKESPVRCPLTPPVICCIYLLLMHPFLITLEPIKTPVYLLRVGSRVGNGLINVNLGVLKKQ